MGDKIRHGSHSGLSVYRLPPDAKWLVVDPHDGEYTGMELASVIGESAVHLTIDGDGNWMFYLHFPSFNTVARNPITDAIKEHGLMSPEAKAAIDKANRETDGLSK